MGPGTAIKAVTGSYFSLMVFGFAQVVIDIEPLIRIIRHDKVLHGLTHTYLGAFIIGLFSLFAGRFLCQWMLRIWNAFFINKYMRWLQVNTDISWVAAITGAFIGTFTHVLLDSLMHEDVQPFFPFSLQNNLLHLISPGWAYLICSLLGVFGFLSILFIWLWNKWSIEID